MSDSEVATYVLAYLLRGSYQNTASAFLQECTVLPSKTVMILPETPLQTVIADYKAQKDTRVMVDTMGGESAWAALCDKLEQNVSQLRHLSSELLAANSSTAAGRGRRRARTRRAATATKVPGQEAQGPPPVQPDTPSPQKRKSAPHKRKISVSDEAGEAAPASLPSQLMLETMLCDKALPEKLAEIINRCVTRSPDREVDDSLSPTTVDNIFNLTCAEPAFEALLTGTSPVKWTKPLPMALPQEQYLQSTATEEAPVKRARLSSPLLEGLPTTSHAVEGLPTTSPVLEGNARLPAEIDIENFLDQLHQ